MHIPHSFFKTFVALYFINRPVPVEEFLSYVFMFVLVCTYKQCMHMIVCLYMFYFMCVMTLASP